MHLIDNDFTNVFFFCDKLPVDYTISAEGILQRFVKIIPLHLDWDLFLRGVDF